MQGYIRVPLIQGIEISEFINLICFGFEEEEGWNSGAKDNRGDSFDTARCWNNRDFKGNDWIFTHQAAKSSQTRTDTTFTEEGFSNLDIASAMAMEVEETEGKTVLCLLTDPDGTPLGSSVYLPQNTEPQHLQQIVNQLLKNV